MKILEEIDTLVSTYFNQELVCFDCVSVSFTLSLMHSYFLSVLGACCVTDTAQPLLGTQKDKIVPDF